MEDIITIKENNNRNQKRNKLISLSVFLIILILFLFVKSGIQKTVLLFVAFVPFFFLLINLKTGKSWKLIELHLNKITVKTFDKDKLIKTVDHDIKDIKFVRAKDKVLRNLTLYWFEIYFNNSKIKPLKTCFLEFDKYKKPHSYFKAKNKLDKNYL